MKNSLAITGWLLAATLVGFILASGFQSNNDKSGVVDLEKVVFESEEGKRNAQRLDQAVSARQGVLDFLRTHRVATAEQGKALRDLSLKQDPSVAEKQELETVKATIIASSKEFDALNQKQEPTDEDRNRLRALNAQFQSTTGLLEEWSVQFQQELQTMRDQMVTESGKKAAAILKDIAKADGYSIIFATPRTALYGSNDVTDKVIKALDAKK